MKCLPGCASSPLMAPWPQASAQDPQGIRQEPGGKSASLLFLLPLHRKPDVHSEHLPTDEGSRRTPVGSPVSRLFSSRVS